jgi:hypothetical protein
MKQIIAIVFITIYLLSCSSFKSLNSTTYIKANDEFILGNNVHGKFNVNVKNTSNFEIAIWQYPISGGRHSLTSLKPFASIKLDIDKNTSLRIENHSNEQVAVKLKVKGDTGLSMGYKN